MDSSAVRAGQPRRTIREDVGSGGDRQLTLASSPTIASVWLARQLPDFQRAHPDIEIRTLTVEDPYRLDLAEFDLGIYYHVPREVELHGLCSLLVGN